MDKVKYSKRGEAYILIESQWNLNRFGLSAALIAASYINRITVEFKLDLISLFYILLQILIESQWNLNLIRKMKKEKSRRILIESQWNLNLSGTAKNMALERILIESQWNLNDINFNYNHITSTILIESQWNLNLFNYFVCMVIQ